MQSSTLTRPLTYLEAAVLRTVVYADLFDYPLVAEEVWRFLPAPASQSDTEVAIASLAAEGILVQHDGYVMLWDRQHIVALRNRRRGTSAELWTRGRRYGRLIARLPFVRMVAITGSLAVENAEAGDDLDYLIVTAQGRVWLTRAMTMVLVRLAALRGVTLCPNYLLSEAALELPERDFYTARELRQMAPVAGQGVYVRMLAANTWWHDYLPNAQAPSANGNQDRPFDGIESWLLARKGAELRRGAGPEAVFDETMCKGHFEGWRERTHRMVEERMKTLLEPTS